MSDDEIPTEIIDNIIPLDVVVKARKESKKRKKPEKESLDGREVSRDPVYIRTVITALKGWEELDGLVYFDTFSSRIMRNKKIPLTNPVDEELPVPWMDRDTLALQVYMGRWLVKVEKGLLFDAVSHMAYENARSSAAEFFGGLDPWDGVERLDDFFVKVCNIDEASPQHDYVRQVSRRIFIGLVARVFKPGCKMETAPILEGAQGVLKSSLLEAMAMKDKWYSNKMPHNLSDVDTKDHIKGKLIVELPELVQMRGKEAEETKAFMSISVDEHRSKFGRNPHIYYRQCVFFGSTNEKHYLKDETGNRRFWPINCGDREIDLKLAKEMLPQVYAEAIVAYESGEAWWFKFNDEMMLAQQEERTVGEDTWVTNIRDWVRTHAMDREYVASMSFLMEKAIVMEKSKTTKSDQMRFAKALIQAGGRRLQRRADGKKNWFWVFNYEQDQQVVDDDGEDGPF